MRYDLDKSGRDDSFEAPPIASIDAKLAVSPNGKYLAIGLFGKVQLYDLKKKIAIGEIKKRFNLKTHGLDFTPNSKSVIVYGNSRNTYEFDVLQGTEKHQRSIVEENENRYVYSMRCANGMLVAAGRGAVAAWPVSSEQAAFRAKFSGSRIDALAKWAGVTPDQQYFVSSHGIWNIPTAEFSCD